MDYLLFALQWLQKITLYLNSKLIEVVQICFRNKLNITFLYTFNVKFWQSKTETG